VNRIEEKESTETKQEGGPKHKKKSFGNENDDQEGGAMKAKGNKTAGQNTTKKNPGKNTEDAKLGGQTGKRWQRPPVKKTGKNPNQSR